MDKGTLLRIALQVRGETLKDFAARLGVTWHTVDGVCRGRITSARVLRAIDDYTHEALPALEPHIREAKGAMRLAA